MTLRISCMRAGLTASNSLVPFLYQTRTLTATQRHPSRQPIQRRPRSLYSTSNAEREEIPQNNADRSPRFSDDSEGIASVTASPEGSGVPKLKTSFLRKRASVVPQKAEPTKRSKPLRTMTRGEKETFSNLLEQLASMRQEQKQEENQEGTKEAETKQPLSDEERNEMSHISSIFDGVLNDIRRKRRRLDRSGQSSDEELSAVDAQQAEEQNERPNIAAIDMKEVNEDIGLSPRGAAGMVARRESAKIEYALRKAIKDGRGDTGVWEICKHRIFSMLQHLNEKQDLKEYLLPGPGSSALAQLPGGWPKDATLSSNESQAQEPDRAPDPDILGSSEARTEDADRFPDNDQIDLSEPQHEDVGEDLGIDPLGPDETEEESMPASGPLEIPSSVPPEAVVSVLYPRMLLVAFRLINTHFPNSPLISQFRSTIRSHGRVSAVLGASTGLYNELLYFQWRGCNDLPGVVSLLREMELTGVDLNRRTKALLDSIMAQRENDLRKLDRRRRQGDGRPMDPWWDLAPNKRAMQEITKTHGFVRQLLKDAGKSEFQRSQRAKRLRKRKFHGRR